MEEEIPVCQGCGHPIDQCSCTCPHCGTSSECDCAIGFGVATGG